MVFVRTALALATAAFCSLTYAAETAEVLDPVQVTATRLPESVNVVPASVSIITGEELLARGANNLRTALSLVAGVEGTPGGDSGSAGSVPAVWGLREADAYLLVVDGVPWGGAFNPATPSIDLVGIDRIEVLRGAAPVMYGATSFNGVIHVIHAAAGTAVPMVSLSAGSFGTVAVTGVTNLPTIGGYAQSLSGSLERRGSAVHHEEFQRYHLLYRGASKLEIGRFHVDADVSVLPQTPGSVIFRNGSKLRTDLLPLNANYNPADGKLDQTRYQLNLGLDSDTSLGVWGTTLSLAHTHDRIVRGFLRDYAPMTGNQAGDSNKPDDFDADGYSQQRNISDLYFDSHLVIKLAEESNLTVGLDHLYGKGRQRFNAFAYFVDLSGNGAPNSSQQHVDELGNSQNQRNFSGLYTQLDWQALPNVDVLAGLRLNHTQETAKGRAIANDMDQMALAFDGKQSSNKTRLSGVVGASWHLFKSEAGALTVYGDYRNTYKPKAVDFGPEAEVSIQQPETANSYELGLKGAAFAGVYTYDLSVFLLDFNNLLTFDTNGQPIDGGKERFQGFEYEGRYALSKDLKLATNYAYHDSRFKSLTINGGANDVSGNRLELSPYNLAGVGVLYTPAQGFNATLVANYAGERKLNKRATAHAGGYTTWDATLGYQIGALGLHLNGYNLTDRRVPVSESELAEVVSGASSYYLLPARLVTASISYRF